MEGWTATLCLQFQQFVHAQVSRVEPPGPTVERSPDLVDGTRPELIARRGLSSHASAEQNQLETEHSECLDVNQNKLMESSTSHPWNGGASKCGPKELIWCPKMPVELKLLIEKVTKMAKNCTQTGASEPQMASASSEFALQRPLRQY